MLYKEGEQINCLWNRSFPQYHAMCQPACKDGVSGKRSRLEPSESADPQPTENKLKGLW